MNEWTNGIKKKKKGNFGSTNFRKTIYLKERRSLWNLVGIAFFSSFLSCYFLLLTTRITQSLYLTLYFIFLCISPSVFSPFRLCVCMFFCIAFDSKEANKMVLSADFLHLSGSLLNFLSSLFSLVAIFFCCCFSNHSQHLWVWEWTCVHFTVFVAAVVWKMAHK